MGKITKFEDIEAWQDSRLLTGTIYRMTETWKDFSLKDQMRRASVSVMSNIAEGYARRGNKEFIQFMFISKASCAELQNHLYFTLDLNYILLNKREKFCIRACALYMLLKYAFIHPFKDKFCGIFALLAH